MVTNLKAFYSSLFVSIRGSGFIANYLFQPLINTNGHEFKSLLFELIRDY